MSNGTAARCFLVEVPQLHAQNGSLNLVDAAIHALIDVVIAAVGAVIGKRPHGIGELPVVGGDGTGIAHCAKVLSGVEARSGSMPEPAGGISAPQPCHRRFGIDGLGVVFDEQQAVGAGKLDERGVAARCAVEVHRHYGAGACINCFFNQ